MIYIYIIISITFSSLFVQARDDCLQEAPVNELGRSMRPEKQTFYIHMEIIIKDVVSAIS